MKRLYAALIFVFLITSFCFAQIQRGNASYNESKQGLTISHPSLSFNTKVKVTNLGNNRSTEASVNGRIPISPERIADISRETGDILGMDKNGMTLVQIEVLTAAREAPPAPEPSPPAAAPAAPPPAVTQVLPLQTVTDVQYVPVPAPAPASGQCCYLPFLLAILILLFLIFAVLVVIAVLLRRFPWPWYYYPLRVRRCRGQKLIPRRGRIKN
ncbi:MAG: hypothetical protein LBC31_09905 [Treponema sp.]|jgi:hypothetical protein|nr:hypothetical protein [Treponema sp.]